MNAIAVQTMRGFLILAFASQVFAQSDQVPTATLICQVQSQEGSVKTITLTVDYGSGTVNGNPAQISDTSVTWHSRSDQFNLDWVVNRYTGEIHTIVRDSPRDPVPLRYAGTCQRATERKF